MVIRRCDGRCNDCGYGPMAVASYQILQLIEEKHGSIIGEINKICPNMSCCPECGVDDFCHAEGCSFEISEKSKTRDKYCMCEEIGTVARDGKSTCMKCGGVDAYGAENRIKFAKQKETAEVKE